MIKKLPDTLVIISIVLVAFAVFSWIIPAGEFQRIEKNGHQMVVQNSFKEVKQQPQGIAELFQAPVKGFAQTAVIIAFVLFVGGVFGVVNSTGAIEAGLTLVLKKTSQNPRYKRVIIPLLLAFFAITGATFGLSEEVLIFVLITIPLCISLGYDSLIGVAVPLVGTAIGFGGAVTNPFTIGIAQSIGEIPLFSGWEYRLFCLTIFTVIGITYLVYYMDKIEKNPNLSPVKAIDDEFREKMNLTQSLDNDKVTEFTLTRKIVVACFFLTIIILVVGSTMWSWYINQICALFLGLAIVTAVVYGIKANDLIASFMHGAKDMLSACLVIAFSKGIIILATEGKIIDTILYSVAHALEGFHPVASAEIMFFIQSLINVIVPSGSGQAALTMPILAPLSDIIGLTRQTAVLIFQMGDGLNNMIIPTSGVTMGTLAIAKIPYHVWVKWIFPLMMILFLVSMILLIPPAAFMNYGPR
jgi:uncharacterized ion transporter superfamily protein YfcC